MQLTDPGTWFGGGDVTDEAQTELAGLDKRPKFALFVASRSPLLLMLTLKRT